MKKITFLGVALFCNLAFSTSIPKLAMANDTMVVEILDETLNDAIDLIDKNFQQPTILVYPNLISINSSIIITETSNLIEVHFPKLTIVEGDIDLNQNNNLTNITLPSLEVLSGNLVVHDNHKLITTKFQTLQIINGNMDFNHNPNLIEVYAPNFIEICGEISFGHNDELEKVNFPSLVGLGFCSPNDPKKMLYISDCHSLNEIVLPNLEYVGDFFVHDNKGLMKLETPNLNRALSIHINHNPAMEQLDMQKLDNVETSLHINGNTELKFIDLKNLINVIDELHIMDNSKLEYLNLCSYPAPEVQFHENNEPIMDVPNFIIFNNTQVDYPPFCPDQKLKEGEENPNIEEDSENSPKEEFQVTIYPNPTEDRIHVESEVEFDKIEIYDFSGNFIESFRPNEAGYDISHITSGVYLMVMHHKNSIYASIKKLVIK